jgi:N-acyl amino acid synthase of PEP-CTERM/exosortase system
MTNDLLSVFDKYFEVITADSPELLEELFRLRYTVMCIEKRLPGFEPLHYPDGMETDDYDRHSHHILLKHRPSGSFIGGARLIFPDPSNPSKPFPVEQHTQIDSVLIDISKLPRRQTVEISRFIVLGKFSRRREERRRSVPWTADEERDPKSRRRFPHPMLAIVVGIMRLGIQQGVTHWLSAMEPALNRLLSLYGLQLDPIGPLVDYLGPRRPYSAEISKVLDRIHTNNRPIWELITNQGKIHPVSTGRIPDQVLNAGIVAEPGRSSLATDVASRTEAEVS